MFAVWVMPARAELTDDQQQAIKDLRHSSEARRIKALATLRNASDELETVATAICRCALQFPGATRKEAFLALDSVSPRLSPIFRDLLTLPMAQRNYPGAPYAERARQTYHALLALGSEGKPALVVYEPGLSRRPIDRDAWEAFMSLAPTHPAVLKALRRLATSKQGPDQLELSSRLHDVAKADPHVPKQFLGAIGAMLVSKNPAIFCEGFHWVKLLGRDALPLRPTMEKLTTAPDPVVRDLARAALAGLDGPGF